MMTRSQFGAMAQRAESSRVKAVPSVPLALFAALLLAVGAVLFPSHAQADLVAGAASSESDGPVGIYAGLPSETNWSEDLSNLFYYSDSLFANPAGTYNEDLAIASVNLAAAADNSNTGGSDYSQKSKNIVRLLQDIGCSDVVANAGFTNKPCAESNIGVAIGNKSICVNGQDYRLFVIGARGGGYEQEWSVNMKIGDGTSTDGDHQGFQEARDATIAFVMDYIKGHVRDGEHVKVWASGYCRGGVAVNMACAWLDKWICERNGGEVPNKDAGPYNADHSVYGANYSPDEMRFTQPVAFDPSSFIDSSVKFSESDVYCYPVNPPQGASKEDVEASKDLTAGIHNLVNPDDWYPQVAPNWEGWGFARYGTDHDLTGTYGPGESFADHDKSILQTNAQGLADAVERLKKINPEASYTSPQFREYFFSLGSFALEYDEAGKGNEYVSKGAEMKYNQGKYFEEIFRLLLDAAGCTSRADYTRDLQDDIMYLFNLTLGAPLDVRDKLGSVAMKQALAALEKETGYDINTTMGKLMIASKVESWMAEGDEGEAAMPAKILKTTFVGTLNELAITYDEAKIDSAVGSIAKIVKGLYKKEQALGFFSFYHIATVFKAGGSINQAHWPEVALAWLPEPQKKCVVHVTSETSGAGTLSGEGMYATGASATLKAEPVDGFEFTGWYENGVQVSTEPAWTFAVEGNRRIEAQWSYQGSDSYSVTFDANGGSFEGGQLALEEIIAPGKPVAPVLQGISDPKYGDYSFKGWTTVRDDASTLIDLGTYRMPNHATKLYALWLEPDGSTITAEAHVISLRIEGGTYSESLTRRTGESFGPLPILKQYLGSGCYVASWTAHDGTGAEIAEVTESSIVTAAFPESFVLVANVADLPKRTVRFFANTDDSWEASGTPVFEVNVYESGKVRISDASPDVADIDTGIVRYKAPERANSVFAGWSTKEDADGTSIYYPADTTLYYNEIPDGGLDLFAAWIQSGLYEIDYRGNGGTSADGDEVTSFASGADGEIGIAANLFARDGYAFVGWNTEADGSGLSVSAGSQATLKQLGLPEPEELEELFKNAQTEEQVDAVLQKATLILYAQWATPLSNAKVDVSGITDKTWTGKAQTQQPVVKLAGKTLKSGVDYTVTYKNNKNVGTATATIVGKGAYTGQVAKTFKINPKGTSLKKPKGAKKAIKVKWKKQTKKMSQSRVTGYQVQVATDKKFAKNKKTVTVKGFKKKSKRIKKLKAKKKYYVRVRTYMKVGKAKYYSPWSKAKRTKTR